MKYLRIIKTTPTTNAPQHTFFHVIYFLRNVTTAVSLALSFAPTLVVVGATHGSGVVSFILGFTEGLSGAAPPLLL